MAHRKHISLRPVLVASVLLILLAAAQSHAELPPAPVAHWAFDEGEGGIAYDSVGGLVSTIHGAAWTTGVAESWALELDGAGDYVDCGSTFNHITEGSEKTVTAWAKSYTNDYSGQHDGNGRIITLNRSGGYTGFSLICMGNPATWSGIYATAGDGYDFCESGRQVTANEWTHLAMTQDSAKVAIYIDGEPANLVENAVAPVVSVSDNALFGAYNSGQIASFFQGDIDEIAIYDRALSPEEITQVYESVVYVPPSRAYYVNGLFGSDNNDGLTPETAFATIARGMAKALDGDTVLVYPGVYAEQVIFEGKAVTLQGMATAQGMPIIEAPDNFGVSFYYGEGPESILRNFVIRNCQTGVFIASSSPTIMHLTVVSNNTAIAAYGDSDPNISNCILWNNAEDDLFGCQARYSFTESEAGNGAPPEPPMPEGLVSFWPFDEGLGGVANDAAGGNNATITGAEWVEGRISGALAFDGPEASADCGNNGGLNPPGEITISAWIKTDTINASTPRQRQPIACRYDAAEGKRSYELVFDDNTWCPNRLTFTISSTAGSFKGAVLCSDTILDTGKWYHVAARFKASVLMEIYIDGVDHTSGGFVTGNLPSGMAANDISLKIGNGYISGEYFNGTIDEVMIFDRAVSPEEIEDLYLMANEQEPPSAGGPLFADPGAGDYHLRSERGRHWPEYNVWVLDDATSPAVDAGDPANFPAGEPSPNGGRVNMGAYGGTAYASMSEWPITADLNQDGVVNLFDFAALGDWWLEQLDWVP